MKGIIENQMGSAESAPSAVEAGEKFKSGVEKAVPPELQPAFARVVVAGKKLFYSPQMEDTIREELSREGPIEKKLAEGVMGLMAILDSKAKPAIPVQVIIPAAIELLYEVTDFLAETGLIQKLAPEQLKTATQLTVMLVAKRYGASEEQIKQMMTGKAPASQPVAQPALPPTSPASAQPLA